MKARFVELGAIIKYELVMQRRSRGLSIFTVTLLGLLIIFSLVSREGLLKAAQQGQHEAGFTIAVGIVSSFWVVLIMLMPAFVAESIPKDRQQGVDEILHSTPMRPGAYLTGKLVSVWLAVLVSLFLVLLIVGGWYWLFIGPYEVSAPLAGFAFMIVPTAIINLGLSVLLAAGQPTRRRAIAVGVGFSILTFAMIMAAASPGDFLHYLTPDRLVFMNYTFFNALGNPATVELPGGPATLAQYSTALTIGLAELFAAWLVVWLWLRRK